MWGVLMPHKGPGHIPKPPGSSPLGASKPLHLHREGNDRGCPWVQCPQARLTSRLSVLLLKVAIRPSWRKSLTWQATPLLAPGHSAMPSTKMAGPCCAGPGWAADGLLGPCSRCVELTGRWHRHGWREWVDRLCPWAEDKAVQPHESWEDRPSRAIWPSPSRSLCLFTAPFPTMWLPCSYPTPMGPSVLQPTLVTI